MPTSREAIRHELFGRPGLKIVAAITVPIVASTIAIHNNTPGAIIELIESWTFEIGTPIRPVASSHEGIWTCKIAGRGMFDILGRLVLDEGVIGVPDLDHKGVDIIWRESSIRGVGLLHEVSELLSAVILFGMKLESPAFVLFRLTIMLILPLGSLNHSGAQVSYTLDGSVMFSRNVQWSRSELEAMPMVLQVQLRRISHIIKAITIAT